MLKYPQMIAKEDLSPQHPEGLAASEESLILSLYDLDAIRFGEYRWKLHDSHPEAPLLPIYTDFRMVQREPSVKSTAVDIYEGLLKSLDFDLIAGIPIAAIPFASSLSDRLGVGQITPRIDIKAHGSGTRVDGLREGDRGKTAVLVDDLVSFSDSKIEAADMLREAGIIVNDVVVLMDYEFGGREELRKRDLSLHSAFTVSQVLAISLRLGKISQQQFEEVKYGLDRAQEYFREN